MCKKPASNIGILRILAKKNYCAVIASHRRSNPYACRLLRHFIPRNDNLTEDLNLVYNKPLSVFLLKRGRRDYKWIARPFPSGGYPERMNKPSYCILLVNAHMIIRHIHHIRHRIHHRRWIQAYHLIQNRAARKNP